MSDWNQDFWKGLLGGTKGVIDRYTASLEAERQQQRQLAKTLALREEQRIYEEEKRKQEEEAKQRARQLQLKAQSEAINRILGTVVPQGEEGINPDMTLGNIIPERPLNEGEAYQMLGSLLAGQDMNNAKGLLKDIYAARKPKTKVVGIGDRSRSTIDTFTPEGELIESKPNPLYEEVRDDYVLSQNEGLKGFEAGTVLKKRQRYDSAGKPIGAPDYTVMQRPRAKGGDAGGGKGGGKFGEDGKALFNWENPDIWEGLDGQPSTAMIREINGVVQDAVEVENNAKLYSSAKSDDIFYSNNFALKDAINGNNTKAVGVTQLIYRMGKYAFPEVKNFIDAFYGSIKKSLKGDGTTDEDIQGFIDANRSNLEQSLKSKIAKSKDLTDRDKELLRAWLRAKFNYVSY